MRPILWRQEIAVLNGDLDHGIPTRIELQLCGPSDRDVPSADDPIVIVYSADDDPQLGDELRLPLAALKEFIESSADLLAPNLKKGGRSEQVDVSRHDISGASLPGVRHLDVGHSSSRWRGRVQPMCLGMQPPRDACDGWPAHRSRRDRWPIFSVVDFYVRWLTGINIVTQGKVIDLFSGVGAVRGEPRGSSARHYERRSGIHICLLPSSFHRITWVDVCRPDD